MRDNYSCDNLNIITHMVSNFLFTNLVTLKTSYPWGFSTMHVHGHLEAIGILSFVNK